MRYLFPDVTDFGELFDVVGAYPDVLKAPAPPPAHVFPLGRREAIVLSRFCSQEGAGPYRPSLAAVLKPERAAALRRELVVPGRLSFRVVHRDDGTALVVASYDQLLADRWLALVPSASVPPAPDVLAEVPAGSAV